MKCFLFHSLRPENSTVQMSAGKGGNTSASALQENVKRLQCLFIPQLSPDKNTFGRFFKILDYIQGLFRANAKIYTNFKYYSCFGTFLRSELKFLKLLVQSKHHCVTCARQKSSFSFLWTSCKCFGTSMQMIMYNSLLFPTLSIAYVMLIKMYYNGSLLNSLTPPQHLGISSSHKSLHAKWLNKLS